MGGDPVCHGCLKSDRMTDAESEAHRQHIETMQVRREAALLATQRQAGQTAATLWSQANAITAHCPSSRGVQRHGPRVFVDKLLIPRETTGTLHGLQT
jgi:hypothetical protein